jgi:HD-like signal output (HDOD) protein
MVNGPAVPTYQSGKTSVAPSGNVAPEALRVGALEFLADLASELSSGKVNLPCFPDIVLRIRRALDDPKNTPAQTVNIVGAEPRLAARLLQTANSATFNPTGRPITELRTAITRLGHQLVHSATMAFAVQHMRDQETLRSIAQPLSTLWKESISVALICQVVARRTRVTPDEAFLTGLLHGIGRLYIMVRAVGKDKGLAQQAEFQEMIAGWQASIGKAVLENWEFADHMCEAIANQRDYDRPLVELADLSDVLIVSMVLGDALRMPSPRTIDSEGIAAFQSIGLDAEACEAILKESEEHLVSLQDALGC